MGVTLSSRGPVGPLAFHQLRVSLLYFPVSPGKVPPASFSAFARAKASLPGAMKRCRLLRRQLQLRWLKGTLLPAGPLGHSPAHRSKLPRSPETRVRWSPTPCREHRRICGVAEAAGCRVGSPAATSFGVGANNLSFLDTFPWKLPLRPGPASAAALTGRREGNVAALCLNRHGGTADGVFFPGPSVCTCA